ncbi:MAG: sulfite exporter TauE/SafE family protein [Verrucomicrobium sp.]|nr:sulfite exporter TauE/SafE family protein [Verrucomicrobium sp.]
MDFNLPNAIAGLLVGVVVGATGVGGGALMTPVLVLLFGVAPQTAVGTDLLFAALTKIFGTAVHHRQGTVDWPVVKRLALGSLPAAAVTLAWMTLTATAQVRSGFLIKAVAVALLITAAGILSKDWLQRVGRNGPAGMMGFLGRSQVSLTVVAGVVLGVLVTLTSIGAGALGTVLLVYLYPVRLTPGRLVGTDLAHAIPLTLIAGTGHLMMGNVDGSLLTNLLMGSIPGVLAGSWVSTRAPMQWVRVGLAVILAAVAAKMLAT